MARVLNSTHPLVNDIVAFIFVDDDGIVKDIKGDSCTTDPAVVIGTGYYGKHFETKLVGSDAKGIGLANGHLTAPISANLGGPVGTTIVVINDGLSKSGRGVMSDGCTSFAPSPVVYTGNAVGTHGGGTSKYFGILGTSDIIAGTKHCIAVSWNLATGAKFQSVYVNGVIEATNSVDSLGSANDTAKTKYIGGAASGGYGGFSAQYVYYIHFRKVLSKPELDEIYNSLGANNTISLLEVDTSVPTPITFNGSIPAQTGSANTPYNLNLSSYFTGNRTPFTYALASGSLPAGLSLSGSTITGTPTTTSTGLTFSIRGTDADGATATSNVVGITINAAPIPVGFSGTIPQLSGIVNSSVSRNVASYFTGSETPFTYAIASGSLPAGVTLSGSTLTGTPTVSGTFNVSIRATDTKSNVATSNSFAIVISASPIAIGFSGSIPAQTGTLNTPFSLNLSSYFTGNRTPFTFSVVSGSLPAGLSINGDVISGTPTSAGTGAFTIRGTDTANNIATSNSVSFTINTAPIPVAFTGTINPINAAVNIPVNVDVSSNFTGNIKPFTYAIASGGLPSGLSLNGSVITGTPTSVATTSLTIRATDNQGNTAVSNSISVNIAASVTPVTFTGTIGSLSGTKGLPLNSTNITGYFWGSLTPFVYNIQSGVLPSGVVLNNGVLQGTPTITGTFPITVRATDTGSNVATSNEFSVVISEPAAGTTIISRSNMTPTTVTISANYSGTDNSGFEYSLSSGPWVAVPVSPFTVEGLTEYTSYTLVVRPKVATNDGLVSNTLTFKTYRGVLASQVPSTGVSGPSCIYNDITKHNTLQNDYVYCNYLTEPAGGNGVFTPKPDGSFSWVGAADGVYTFTYQYEVNNVEIGPVKNVKLIIG